MTDPFEDPRPEWLRRHDRGEPIRPIESESARLARAEMRRRSERFADPYDPESPVPREQEEAMRARRRCGDPTSATEASAAAPDLPAGLAPETVSAAVGRTRASAETSVTPDDTAAVVAGTTPDRLRAQARSAAGWSAPDAPAAPDAAPRPATVERQAMIYSLFHDPYEQALLADITPLDILEAVSRRHLANGNLQLAVAVAAIAAPYVHTRADRPRAPDAAPPAVIDHGDA